MTGMQSEYKKTFGLYANKMGMVLPDQPSISTSTGKIEAWDSLDHYATLGFSAASTMTTKAATYLNLICVETVLPVMPKDTNGVLSQPFPQAGM